MFMSVHGDECEYALDFLYDHKVAPEHYVRTNYSEIDYVFWLLRDGWVRIERDGVAVFAEKGDAVVFDPLFVRSHFFEGPASLISIWFKVRWRGLDFVPPHRPVRIAKGMAGSSWMEISEKLCRFTAGLPPDERTWKRRDACRRASLFCEWLSKWHEWREAIREPELVEMDPRVYEAMGCLAAQAETGQVDLEGLRQQIGLSRAQISRLFRQGTGMTPKQWAETRSYAAAQDLLRHGKLSIKEIAGRLGFYDSSHFTRWFREKSGMPPTEWRSKRFSRFF